MKLVYNLPFQLVILALEMMIIMGSSQFSCTAISKSSANVLQKVTLIFILCSCQQLGVMCMNQHFVNNLGYVDNLPPISNYEFNFHLFVWHSAINRNFLKYSYHICLTGHLSICKTKNV